MTTVPGDRRERWELEERIVELAAELAERAAREQQLELEVTALRHELELRAARDASQEERIALTESRLGELRADLRWLQGHADAVTARFEEARQAVAGLEQARADAAAAAVAYAADVGELHQQAGELQRALDEERAAARAGLASRVAQLAAWPRPRP